MTSMIRQILPGLRLIHKFGYAHSDLKSENICARKTADGSFKFTLIDLGMASKLPNMEEFCLNKQFFRGNYMFAGVNQIETKRAAAIDDVFSLLCVAYFFINGSLPWLDYIHKENEVKPKKNTFHKEKFINIRCQYESQFDLALQKGC